MKIGTCVWLEAMDEMEEKFASLVANGFETCQLLSWKPELYTAENAAIIKQLIEKYNVTVTAFWCGWEGPQKWNFYEGHLTLGLVPVEYRHARMKNLCAGADFAHILGIKDIITHMGYIPENPYDPNFHPFCVAVRHVAQYLKRNGQYLLFETGQETPVVMLRCFEVVGMDNLGVNLDTANLICYGKGNPVDALEVFGKYVRNLHAKDAVHPKNGHELGKEVRIGEGKVDFKAVFRKLKELGYDSHVTIEREIEGEEQLKDILASRIYLQQIIEEVYGNENL